MVIGYLPFALIVSFLFEQVTSDVQLYSEGEKPKSLPLNDNSIATFLPSGFLHSETNGNQLDFKLQDNTFSLYKLAQFPDGSLLSYNGMKITYFSEVFLFISSVTYSSNMPATDYISADAIDNDKYILSAVINNLLSMTIFDKSITLGHVVIKETFVYNVVKNSQCSARSTKGYLCMFIENVPKRFLTVLVLDEALKEIQSPNTSTNQGDFVKYKKAIGEKYLVCFINPDTDAFCSLYDDSAKSLTKPTLVVRTGNYDMEKCEIGILSAKEMLFVYAFNSIGEIRIQKLNNMGVPKGSYMKYSIQIPYSQISVINYLIFPNRLHGIVYGLPHSIHFKELSIPYCFDYCSNVGSFSTTDIDLTLYATLSSDIKFTRLPSRFTGTFYSGKKSVDDGVNYSNPLFSFATWSIRTIASAKYVVVNTYGESSECSINIFIGEKGNCKCPENTFTFYDECLPDCPSYTYSDTVTMVCSNCASSGLFLYKGTCINRDSAPENTFVSDRVYNVLSDCEPYCRTCSGSTNKCITCVPFDLNCPISCGPGTFYALALGDCKACYDKCATCTEEGDDTDHKCTSCIRGYEVYPATPNLCTKSCSANSLWYLDDNQLYNCVYSTDCPSHRPIYITETRQCVESCSKTSTCLYCQTSNFILKQYKTSCVKECPTDTLPNDKAYTCDNIPNIEINITDKPMNDTLEDLNDKNLTKPNITIIKGDNYTVEIFNSTSQGGNLALSQIDFGACEKILRKQYSIPDGEVLVFVKFDLDRVNSNTDQVEYQVRDSKGKILDLNYCKDERIDITYQIKNSSLFDLETAKKYEKLGIDIYNSEDPFFQDICFPFTTDNGTDIILRDRLKDIYKNISVCEEACSYKGVDLVNLTVTCSCQVKVEVKSEVNMNAFTQSLTSAFTNSNFMVVTCYNLVFDSSIVLTNFGFWFSLVLMILHLPNWLYYFSIGVAPIMKYFAILPKSPPKRNSDYIDRIISEGNIETRSIKDDLEEDNKLRQFKKSQVLVSPSQSKLNLSLPGKVSHADNKKSLFTLTKLNESKYSQDSNEDSCSNNNENANNHPFSNSQSSRHILHSSCRSNNVNIIQSCNDEEDSRKIDFDQNDAAEKANESNRMYCSIYSSMKGSNMTSFYPKTMVKKEGNDSLNRSNYSNQVIYSNDKNHSVVISNKPAKPQQSRKPIGKLMKGEESTPKKMISSKFNPVKGKSNFTVTATSTMNDSQHLNTKNPFKTTTMTEMSEKIDPSMEILDDFDLNTAQLYDTRSFWRQLWICMKAKHPILATFVFQYHFSLRCVVIINFLFANLMDFAFNAFFYTDDLISNRYHYEGDLGFLFDLQNNIVISIASFAVSLVIGFFLNLLSTSDSKLELVFNSQKTAKHSKQILRNVIRCLKIKLVFFFIVELLFSLFFWYYLTAFCAVYQSSQWSWLSGGFTTFALGLLFPIPIALGIVLVRKLAIMHKKNCLFKLSLWFYKL